MSKRIITQTDIKDKGFAVQALKSEGLAYEEMSSTMLRITSGDLNHATIDLTTGNITGDDALGHRRGKLGKLRQAYAEAKVRHEASREGVTINRREVMKDGRVVLKCRMASVAHA
jgi:hypothetical protein